MKAYQKVNTSDVDLSRLQDYVDQAFSPLLSKQILDGVLIEGVVITGGTAYNLSHGLGRSPRLWFVVRKNAQSDVWETTSTYPAQYITLNANNTVTVSLWVA